MIIISTIKIIKLKMSITVYITVKTSVDGNTVQFYNKINEILIGCFYTGCHNKKLLNLIAK